MIRIGNRPILWHIMRYYAAFGHTRVHPLPRLQGRRHQGVLPRLQRGALQRLRARRATAPTPRSRSSTATSARWRITFADTGMQSTIGERLKAVEPYLGDDEIFLATYGDGLSDVADPRPGRHVRGVGQARHVRARPARTSTRTSSRPTPTARFATSRPMNTSGVRINGGLLRHAAGGARLDRAR